jgi:hypothetical protein
MKAPFQLTALEARRQIDAGTLTAEALARSCLERIADREPQVDAWQYLAADAAIARARELDRGPATGPLHGIPFGVKDIIDTFDMPTEYGSPIYRGTQTRNDAACVALQREAGGVRVVHHEVVREEVVIALDLQVVGLLHARVFDRGDAIPVDLPAREPGEPWILEVLTQPLDHPATKPTLGRAGALELAHSRPRGATDRRPGRADAIARYADLRGHPGGDHIA